MFNFCAVPRKLPTLQSVTRCFIILHLLSRSTANTWHWTQLSLQPGGAKGHSISLLPDLTVAHLGSQSKPIPGHIILSYRRLYWYCLHTLVSQTRLRGCPSFNRVSIPQIELSQATYTNNSKHWHGPLHAIPATGISAGAGREGEMVGQEGGGGLHPNTKDRGKERPGALWLGVVA